MHRAQPATLRQEQLARGLVCAVLYAAPALVCLYSVSIADPDIWWHLRTGEWIAQHHAVPYTDQFSVFGSGKPWSAYSWLFELGVLKLYQRWDLVGIVAYIAAMITAITVALHRMMLRLQPDFSKATLLTMAVMISLSRLFTPRPWLFSILFFIVEMDLLTHARRSGRWKELLWLPLIFALWANVHIQFVYGLMAMGIAAAEPLVERWFLHRETRIGAAAWWSVVAASAVATLANPYGWRIYQVALEYSSQRGVLDRVSELQAIEFRAFEDFLLLLLAMGAAGVLAWRRRLQFFETALLMVASVVSFQSRRDVWFMAVIAGSILAANLPSREEQQPEPSGLMQLLAVALAGLLVLGGARLFHVSDSRLREQLAENMPVRAVEMIKQKGYRGAVFNDYDWGGFLIWNLRQPVEIDGRSNLYGDKRIERSVDTWNAQPDWASDPDLSTAGYVIAPVKKPLAQMLRMDPRFELAFEDKLAAVFVNRSVQQSAIAQAKVE